MQIAILTFDGFNELDSFIASGILNRMRPKGWKAFITCPSEVVTSMNGVTIHAERPLEFASTADAVIIGSGIKTREIAQNTDLLGQNERFGSRPAVARIRSSVHLLILIIAAPNNVMVMDAKRARLSRSLRKKTPKSTANTMLVSRTADTSAIGACVIAQMTIQ